MNAVYETQKSALFKRQVRLFAREYMQDVNAGKAVALRFIDRVEEATCFIQSNPFACAVHTETKQHPRLAGCEYHKWRVKEFPHSVFFRIERGVIIIAGMYAQKMNIAVRFPSDIS